MPNEGPVLTLEPVSIWQREVDLDFGGFFGRLGELAAAFGTGDPLTAFKSILGIGESVRLKDLTPQQAAALLIGRAIQRAMVRLVDESSGYLWPGTEKKAAQDLEISLEDVELEVDEAFLRHPPRFEPLTSLESSLRDWLIGAGAREVDAKTMADRLHAYFVVEFHEEWATRRDLYRPMEDYFELKSAEGVGRQRAWDRYNAQLQKQIDEPLLGQAFSLRQTYVPLRAYWTEEVTEGGGRRGVREKKRIRHVVELQDDLDAWVEDANSDNAIRMISGGPGSGKSSAAKMFAARMSRRSDLHVVWVPLHHFDFESKLEMALEKFCTESGTPPEDVLNTSPRVLLIFDGLDELALSGRASQEMAKAFVSELIRLVELRNRNGLTVQALLSGREVAIQEYAAELRRSRILVLLGHFPELEDVSEGRSETLIEEDRRDTWWKLYHDATGKGRGQLPEELRDEKLQDLTSQPLLTVLLAIVWEERGDLDLETPWALNDLYETLLRHVYERKWGGLHPTQRVLSEDRYLRVLEEVAVGAWHSGESRNVSRRQIKERCRQARLEDDLKKFSASAGEGVTQMLTAFYFRRSEGVAADGEMAFEFTHKSFAEYLVARRIAAVLAACHEDAVAHAKNADRGKSTRDLLASWAKLLGPARMEDNLADLVRGEVLRLPIETITGWHCTLEAMLRESVHRGLPMEKVGLSSFPEMKRQARNAELALAVTTAAAASGSEQITDLRWTDPFGPMDWINWLSFGRTELSLLIRKGLYRSVWSGGTFYAANLEGANLEGAQLMRTDLEKANLQFANLTGANLEGAHLVGANLEMAFLDNVNLKGANLYQANLSVAQLVGAQLEGAHLFGADLSGANATGANVTSADLEAVKFNKKTNFRESKGIPRKASYRLKELLTSHRK